MTQSQTAPNSRPLPTPENQLARSALLVTGITVISRILGFSRDVIIAYFLGGSAAADVLVAVFRIPNFIRRLISEGAVSMPFIPEYCLRRRQGEAEGGGSEGEYRAMLFSRSAMLWVIIIFAPLCVLGMLYPENAMLLAAPGFKSRPQEIDAASSLLRCLLPYTLILCTLAVGGGIMQSRSRFLSPVINPCIPNITVLAVMALAAWFCNSGLDSQPENEPAHIALLFCQALLLSGLLQWIYMGLNMRREKLLWAGPVSLKPALGFMKKIPLSLCGTAAHQANILIAGMGASFLADGAIAQMHYADQLITLPLGMFGMAIGIVALPKLTELVNHNRLADLRAGVADNIGLAMYLSLPAAAGLAGIAEPLVKILFMRGAFDANSAHGTALALQGAALCLPALAVSRPLLSVCHVKKYLGLAALIGIVSMGGTALFSIALPKLLPGWELFGIGLSVSLGAGIFAAGLWICLRRTQFTPRPADLLSLRLSFILAVLIFIASRLICEAAAHSPWLAVGVTTPACALAYFSITRLAGCYEAKMVFNAFKNN